MQLQAHPPSAHIQVSNPRGIHILVEKGIDSGIRDLIETPLDGLQSIVVKSNYPMFVSEIFDQNLIDAFNDLGVFSYVVSEDITIRFASENPKDVEKFLHVGSLLAQGLETLNYAYG